MHKSVAHFLFFSFFRLYLAVTNAKTFISLVEITLQAVGKYFFLSLPADIYVLASTGSYGNDQSVLQVVDIHRKWIF